MTSLRCTRRGGTEPPGSTSTPATGRQATTPQLPDAARLIEDRPRDVILGHLEVEFTSGGTTIPLNLIETEQELKGSLK